jgi:hypothetical protein
VNPSSPCYIRVTLTTNGIDYNSNYYKITDVTTIKDLNLSILDDSYKINFSVGYNGALEGYETTVVNAAGPNPRIVVTPKDYIYIRFSPLLSKSFSIILSRNEIMINGTQPPLNPDVTTLFEGTPNEQKTIQVIVPKYIYGNVEIVIKGFLETIAVPKSLSGDAFVGVWTSKEPTVIESNHVVYKSSTYLKTTISLSPTEPDGDNGFYISKPSVSVSVDSGSQIGNVETFVSIDGAQFESYKAPFTLSDGIHSLKYYSVGYSGKEAINESVQETVVKVDSTKPIIELKSPLTTNSRIYTLQANITEDNLKEVSVKIGSILFYPVGNIIKIPTVLFETNTSVTIIAVDYAGNKTEYDCTIELIQ